MKTSESLTLFICPNYQVTTDAIIKLSILWNRGRTSFLGLAQLMTCAAVEIRNGINYPTITLLTFQNIDELGCIRMAEVLVNFPDPLLLLSG